MSEPESFPQAIYGVTADRKATEDFSWIAESGGFTVDKQYLIKHEMFSGSYDVVRSNSNYSVGVIWAYDPQKRSWCSVIVEEQISSKKDFRGRNPKITRFIQLPPQSDPVRYISCMSNQQLSMNESDRGNEAFEPYKFSKHLPQHIDTNDEQLINFAIQCLSEGKRLILKGGKPNNNINDDTPITWNSVYALGLVNQISSKVGYDSLNIAIGYVNIERASLYDIIITFDDDERKWFSGKKALVRNAEFITVESFKPTGSYNNSVPLQSLLDKIENKKKQEKEKQEKEKQEKEKQEKEEIMQSSSILALLPTTIVGDGSPNHGSVSPFTTDVVDSPKEDKKKLSGLPNKTKDGQPGVGTSHPVQGGTSYPVQGGTSYPVQGGTSYPVQGGTSYPVQGGTSYPVQGGTSYPVQGGTSYPVQGGTSHPVQGGTSHPVQGGTSQPGYGGTSQPGGGGTSHPVQGGTSHPVQGGTSYPVQGGTSHPVQGGTSHPVQGGTSHPGGGNPHGARGRINARKNGLNALGNDSWIIGLVAILVVIAVIMMLVLALRSAVPATTILPTLASLAVTETLPATAIETPTITPTPLPSPTPDVALEQTTIAIQTSIHQAEIQFFQGTQDTLAITAVASAMNATATVQTATQQAIVDQTPTATATSPAPIGYAIVAPSENFCRNVRIGATETYNPVGYINTMEPPFRVYAVSQEANAQRKWYRIHPSQDWWVADRLIPQAAEADITFYDWGNYDSTTITIPDITIQQGSC